MRRNLTTVLVMAFLTGLIILFVHPDYRQGQPSLRGTRAKNFAFTLDGKPAQLSDLRGKVVLLNFWATWCPPCVEETPSLIKVQKLIAPLGGTVLGVSVDEDQGAYQQFLKAFGIDFPTYRDPSKQIPLEYGTIMYPDTYVINRHGILERKIVGPQDWTSPEMMAYLDSLLKEK